MLSREIEPELRSILLAKGYTIIGTGFLNHNEPATFPVIVMNPPFSSASKHILRAWQLLRDGGELVAIANAQTLQNPQTKERQLLLELISQNGSWENLAHNDAIKDLVRKNAFGLGQSLHPSFCTKTAKHRERTASLCESIPNLECIVG